MQYTKEEYKEYVKKRSSRSPFLRNALHAFLVGGAICLIGELLLNLYLFLGIDFHIAPTAVTVTLVFLAVLLTALGIFDDIARFAGAGTLLPVTGFANAVVSPAIDTKAEGLVLGVGAKIFTVSGPVILYAILSGALYGVVYYIVTLFL